MSASDTPLGLCLDMPAETYHGIKAMSAGGLKRMQQSPAHFYGTHLDPDRPADTPTAAKANGTLVHCLLLEPAEFSRRFATLPDEHPNRPSIRQRKAAKPSPATVEAVEWWDSFERQTEGRIIVGREELASAMAQAAALRALPDVARLLSAGIGESSAFWIDDATGELCKCRPDWTTPAGDGVIILDGKSCRDASPDGFGRSVWNYAYHLAAAWYSDGYEKATGLPVHGYIFAAVESAWPHAAAAYMLGDDVLEAARTINRRLLNAYARCKSSGQWPGYAPGIQLVNLPKWAHLTTEIEG